MRLLIDDVLSSVDSVFIPHCSGDHDEWEPVDNNELEHAESASADIEHMVLEPAEPSSNTTVEQVDEEECDDSPAFQVQ